MNRNSIRICTRCVQRRIPRISSTTCYYWPGLRTYSSLNLQARSRGTLSCASFSLSRRKLWSSTSSSSLGTSVRTFATASSPQQGAGNGGGPIEEYDRRVEAGLLRDDAHQRSMISHLQHLHERLKSYTPPAIVHPSPENLDRNAKPSLWRSLIRRASPRQRPRPENLPKGLYMYGDVGCGKTMLMDLFYDTMPSNIKRKQRIHFHNFMQRVHQQRHAIKKSRGHHFEPLPMIAADIAETASVLCFDEFQCTDIADAMILRSLLGLLMSHGVVMVTTSNRHPDDLYKNGIQREQFIPCINLLKTELQVLNLNSETDYRKVPRPPSGVYHHPLDEEATRHADKWFEYLGDFGNDPPHPATQEVWGRKIEVPSASGRAARFSFQQLLGRATGAADYLELVRHYDAFVVTDVPGMTLHERDLARRFITFIDAVYESKAKLVLTSAVPLQNLFMSQDEIKSSLQSPHGDQPSQGEADLSSEMRLLMDDLGLSMSALKSTSIFSGDEERFAFARALSRLAEMGSKQWVERGM